MRRVPWHGGQAVSGATGWALYREAEAWAQDCAADYFHHDPQGDPGEFAHECADGSAYVIYYGQALELYNAAQEVRAYGEEVADYVDADATIEERIGVAVYLWARAEIEAAIWERAEDEEEDGDA